MTLEKLKALSEKITPTGEDWSYVEGPKSNLIHIETAETRQAICSIPKSKKVYAEAISLTPQLLKAAIENAELKERIEALIENHGLTNAKVKLIAAEKTISELEETVSKQFDNVLSLSKQITDRDKIIKAQAAKIEALTKALESFTK